LFLVRKTVQSDVSTEDCTQTVRKYLYGGTVDLTVARRLASDEGIDALDLAGDELVGAQIVEKAVREPLRWIAENGGEPGYNGKTGEYVDLIADGVIDPVKVTRSALANAASIASLLLTTETLVVDKPDDEDDDR